MKRVVFALSLVLVACAAWCQIKTDYSQARALLTTEVSASLGTIKAGTKLPNVSYVTYLVDKANKRLILYLDVRARHFRNIVAVPDISVMVSDTSGTEHDPGNRARLTFSGTAVTLKESDPSFKTASEAYFARFPISRGYEDAHNFQFVEVKLADVFFIGGYGHVFPLDMDEFWKSS